MSAVKQNQPELVKTQGSTMVQQRQQASGLKNGSQLGLLYVELAYFPCPCMGFL